MSKQKVNTERIIQRNAASTEHVMEFVADIDGVVYVNDSASITVEKVWVSLSSVQATFVLIIGGIDSRNDYSLLEDIVNDKVRTLICLGTDNSRIVKALLRTGKEMNAAASVQEAVELAAKLARKGEVVLFSPSCPSYHPFDNFKNRGNDFKRAVNALIKKDK